MKKLITLFFIAMTIPLTACAKQFEEGKHYKVISDKATDKPEVREYFSFYCPHCLTFEPMVKSIKKSLPEGVKFEKSHVDFLRAASPEIQAALTSALVVGQQLKMGDKVNAAIFDYIHKKRGAFTSVKDIRNVLTIQGVDGDKFDKLMKSFQVNARAKAMKKDQDKLSRKGALTGVPTFIVNGKYRVEFRGLDQRNFESELKELLAYLSTKS